MLKLPVLHPEILRALGSAGHLATVLITDGNYPHNTRVNPRAPIVFANFVPGVITATTALQMVCDTVPIEAAAVMAPDKTGEYAMAEDPPIWAEFRQVLKTRAGFSADLQKLHKPQFNAKAREEDLCLVIATAEQRIWSNIIVTIGVVR
jgi:L-fucose mutarotase